MPNVQFQSSYVETSARMCQARGDNCKGNSNVQFQNSYVEAIARICQEEGENDRCNSNVQLSYYVEGSTRMYWAGGLIS